MKIAPLFILLVILPAEMALGQLLFKYCALRQSFNPDSTMLLRLILVADNES